MDLLIKSFSIFTQVGIIVCGVVYLVVQFKKGSTTASDEALKLREQQVKAFQDQVKLVEDKAKERENESKDREIRFNNEIRDLNKQIGELTGLLKAREKENKELREIILNRNPEVEIFYKNAMQYFVESKPVIENMKQFMEEMKKYVEDNTKELKTQTKELVHQSEILEQTK